MKRLAIYIVTLFAIVSCTEDIDIELGTTYDRLVVYGELTTDTTTHSVMLTRSMDYFNSESPAGISNAHVVISWDNESIVLLENDTIPGKYQTPSNFFGLPNKTYQLSINNVDINGDGTMETYDAESELKPISEVDSIRLKYWPQFDMVSIRLWAQDSISTDFYMIRGLKNGILITDSLREWGVTDDAFFNGNNTSGIDVVMLNQTKADEKIEPGDVIELEVSSITEEYFKFIMECRTVTDFQTPMFSTTPGNVRSNVSNRAVGFFTAYSISRASVVAEPFKNQK